MGVLWAFLRRDLLIAASYRTPAFFAAVSGLVTLTVFHFLAKTMGHSPSVLERFGTDYFSFALLGVSVASALRALQTSFSARIRETQLDGSLEVLLASPLSTFRVVASLALYPILSALFRMLVLLLLGTALFGARLHLSVGAFVLTLLLSLATFGALGLLSSAFVLVFKRGDPFSYALDTATYLLSGVVYPVEVLPPLLQKLALLLPATHALSALRASALKATTLAELWPTLCVLAGFTLLLWPCAALALTLARRHIERVGSLPHA